MKRFYTIILGASAGLLVTACANINEPLSPLHGEASEDNFNAMVDDPRPAEGDPSTDARVVDAAIERYRSGNVEEPESSGTFRAGSGGG